MLYFAQLIGIPLGILTSAINTRVLGPDDYGILAFYGTVTGFSLIFFRFGFASSAKLLVAQENDENNMRRLIGATTIIFMLIGASYSLFIFGFSFFVDPIFHVNASSILKWAAIPLIAAPFGFMIDAITQGTNRIGTLSFFLLIEKVLLALGVLILFRISKLNVASLVILGLVITIAGNLVFINNLKPRFDELKLNLKKIWKKNKEYGMYLYFGQIADQSTYKLDGIFISYFVNTTQLGFYGLANTMTSPMVMLSQALSTSLFKKFTNMEKIPKKIIYLNLLWLVICIVGFMIIGKYVVILLFSKHFLPVASLIVPLGLASFFQGAYQPYNMFLAANGKARWMKNMSFLATIVNLVGNIILIPIYGVMGATIASIISRLCSFLSHLYCYNKHISTLDEK